MQSLESQRSWVLPHSCQVILSYQVFFISICIPTGFGAGLRSRVTLPSTVVGKAVSIMAWPEYEGSTALDIELCRVEVETVGLGQPCLLQHKKDPAIQFSKDSSHSHSIIICILCPES